MKSEIVDMQGNKHIIDFDNLQSCFINCDCIEALRKMPDNCVDLAVCDPPYGGGATPDAADVFDNKNGGRFGGRFDKYFDEKKQEVRDTDNAEIGTHFHGRGRSKKYKEMYQPEISAERRGCGHNNYDNKINHWDIAPSEEYFEQLFRVSKNQIIWGGNYFDLPPTRCFIIWEKLTICETFSMAMAEYAWTSFNDNAKIFKCAPQGKPGDPRFHPTQKPLALYEWVLSRYAKEGDTILDTHVGSASSLVACRHTNHKYIGFEIDGFYYKKASERLNAESAQVNIFDLLS